MPRSFPPTIADFERDIDQLFDELLVGRWCSPATENEPAIVLERDNAFEVRLCTGAFKPPELEVVVNEKNLTVRGRRGENSWERLIGFSQPLQTELVTAKWANRILTVILPKKSQPGGAQSK